MVILAGVAISMAIGENGVMDRGEKANAAMEQKNIEETIQTSYYYDKDNAGNLIYDQTKTAIEQNLTSAGYTNIDIMEGTDFPITVTATGKTGTYTYIIRQTGIIEEGNGGDLVGDLEILRTYFLGEINQETGERPKKSILTLIEEPSLEELMTGNIILSEIKLKNEGPINNENNPIIINNIIEVNEGGIVYIEYNNNNYKVFIDSASNSTSVTEVSRELVYGKVYSGTITIGPGTVLESTEEFKIAFSEENNRAFILSKNGSFITAFTYDKDKSTVTIRDAIHGMDVEGITFNLSEENLSVSFEYDDTIAAVINAYLTDEGPVTDYEPEKNTELDIYNGWYYNENIDEYIYIAIYKSGNNDKYNNVFISCNSETASGGGSGEASSYLSSRMTELGITKIDSQTLSKDGYTYTLLEKIEIK